MMVQPARLLLSRGASCHILRALVFDRRSSRTEALAALGRAVALARPGGIIRLFPEIGERERLSNKEIAQQLVISPATVKRHTLRIYGKLGVNSRREATVRARQLGFLPTPRLPRPVRDPTAPIVAPFRCCPDPLILPTLR